MEEPKHWYATSRQKPIVYCLKKNKAVIDREIWEESVKDELTHLL